MQATVRKNLHAALAPSACLCAEDSFLSGGVAAYMYVSL